MDPLTIYDYLVLSRGRVLEAVRGLTPEEYRREWPTGLKSVASTVTHIMISEWYYAERLRGRAVASYERWPIRYEEPPGFEAIEAVWRRQAEDVRSAIAAERDWARPIAWESFPDEWGKRYAVTATAGGIVTQLALHEVHHRAQVMGMLRGLGRPVEDVDFNALMWGRRELG